MSLLTVNAPATRIGCFAEWCIWLRAGEEPKAGRPERATTTTLETMNDPNNDRVAIESASAQSKTCTTKKLRRQEDGRNVQKREKTETNRRTRKAERHVKPH